MLKKTINYEDYDGNQQSVTHYFHVSKAEIVELEVSREGGLEATIKKIIETEDVKELIELFKTVILVSIGERSADGQLFTKNDAIRERFVASPAYSELFMELATNTDAATEFIQGILPPALRKQLVEQQDQDKPATLAPPTPKV